MFNLHVIFQQIGVPCIGLMKDPSESYIVRSHLKSFLDRCFTLAPGSRREEGLSKNLNEAWQALQQGSQHKVNINENVDSREKVWCIVVFFTIFWVHPSPSHRKQIGAFVQGLHWLNWTFPGMWHTHDTFNYFDVFFSSLLSPAGSWQGLFRLLFSLGRCTLQTPDTWNSIIILIYI